jgi:hypothetical protein
MLKYNSKAVKPCHLIPPEADSQTEMLQNDYLIQL